MDTETYPPQDQERYTLVLRGDNVIYYRNKPEAKVNYRGNRGGVKMWNATGLHGKSAGCHTPLRPDKRAVLMDVWMHVWEEPIF